MDEDAVRKIVSQQLGEVVHEVGYALGRAWPLLYRNPPRNNGDIATSLQTLDELFKRLRADQPSPAAAMFVNALMTGMSDHRIK